MSHSSDKPRVAIVNYGMGNLFSVRHACEHVGLHAVVASQKEEILSADGIILPGVGAFGDAMDNLENLGLTEILRQVALTHQKPFFGICLGFQLLMEESYEFGYHKGLGILGGSVVRFENSLPGQVASAIVKVPQVGWNRILKPQFLR